jgi:DNA-binding response OmpR family regulator
VTPSILLLLVEDEVLIRMNLEEELVEAGFELVVAASGQQARDEIQADASRFRAVVTDIRLGVGPAGPRGDARDAHGLRERRQRS